MLVFTVALAVGAAAGYALGGRLRHLADLGLRAPLLVAVALALQVGAGLLPEQRRFPLVLCSYAIVALWLVVNATGRSALLGLGLSFLAVGWLLNVAVIVANDGMPVSLSAAREVGVGPDLDVTDGNLYKHVAASADTRLRGLGDVIPVRHLRSVISVGDIAMVVGIAVAVASGMAHQSPAEPTLEGVASPAEPPPRRRAREVLEG